MKKSIILVLVAIFALSATEANAQTWSEWFKQKKTQRKYLMQQIAALKVYAEYAKEGYKIARNGLRTIGSFSRGEFSLHGDFFASLKNVNPKVRNYAKVAEIVALQVKMVNGYNSTIRQIGGGNMLSADELDYLQRVFGRLMQDCEASIDQLISVTADGRYEMTDDQRFAKIDAIYDEMLGRYEFLQAFNREAKLLAFSKRKDRQDVESARALHGITQEP